MNPVSEASEAKIEPRGKNKIAGQAKPRERKPREAKPKQQNEELEPLNPAAIGTRNLKIEILRGLYETVTGKRNREMNKEQLIAWFKEYKGENVVFLMF